MNTKIIVASKTSNDYQAIVTETNQGPEYLIIFVFCNGEQLAAHLTSRDVAEETVQNVLNMYSR